MADFLELSDGDMIDPHAVTNLKVNRNFVSLFAASARPDSRFIHTAAEGLMITTKYAAWIIHVSRSFEGAHITWEEAERLIPQSLIPVLPAVVAEEVTENDGKEESADEGEKR